jgi:predicted phage tail component-like protein
MRNYIILNGVSSETITGLLIQELPPITKPKMRTNIEEIDGRNGDIITELGYSSYDKTISIGLYGQFDIDQVISFFNSSGTVVFSNEPDKYYNYTILAQIDFNRLIRFRTATVKFHCQPFKYSQEDNSKTFTIQDGTTSLQIRNAGNIYSKPVLTITGTGTIGLYLNGVQIFSILLGDLNQIIIDTNNMNAYFGATLLNRMVTGDYNNFKLNSGSNTITWSGTITKIQIDNYSRWI